MIKIDKNIPIPDKRTHKKEFKYPWLTMEVGDSFFVANKTSATYRVSAKAGNRYGRKFTMRNVKDGVRIWRIA
jgi:hypothetical protein